MQFPNLRAFIDQLRKDGDLAVVEAEVDPRLEAAEIHRRVIAAGGPALLFTNPKGSDFRLATNLFGTARRAGMAFGARPSRLIRQVAEAVETLLPPTPSALWAHRGLFAEALKLGTRQRSGGPVLEVGSSPPDLERLPVLTCWPGDGGPFVTLPLVYTEHPDGRGHNLGMYRLQRYSPRCTGMHWQIGKGGGFHYEVAERRGEALPAAVYLGGPPALILAAIAPLPENVPELVLASLIAGGRLPMVRTPEGLPAPAEAEFVLTGAVPPVERRAEGPFGDHYGYYSLEHQYPVFEVGWMGHRKDAIYPATVVGKPRQEDFFVGDLLQELLAPLFPLVMPAVRDLWSYGETGYHSLAAAVVQERYGREAVSAAFRILGEGQLSLTKFLLVTDGAVDLRDFRSVLVHVLERTTAETDLFVFANLSMDTLDYTGPAVNEGSKGVWLGLGEPVRTLPAEFRASTSPAGVADVRVYCPGCLVVGVGSRGQDPGAAERVAADPAFENWPLVVLTDEPQRACASDINFLWTTFTRFEPAADISARSSRVVRNHIAYSAPVVIDARLKKGFPEELEADGETAARVTRRWKEYFPAGMEMGDSGKGHLD